MTDFWHNRTRVPPHFRCKGVVSLGDASRVTEGPHGAIRVGDVDLVAALEEKDAFSGPVRFQIEAVDGITTYEGELSISFGGGYSEYTPMETDELHVGSVYVLGALEDHDGEEIEIKVWWVEAIGK
jgi:hypothetical protein